MAPREVYANKQDAKHCQADDGKSDLRRVSP